MLEQLLSEGKIPKLNGDMPNTVLYHDPCRDGAVEVTEMLAAQLYLATISLIR
jgi:hypothetical protein